MRFKFRMMAVAAVPVLALGTGLAAATAASAANENQLLAKGTVTEIVPGGNWGIQFAIHAHGHGSSSNDRDDSSNATVRNSSETISFDGSLCSGMYTDPVLGGTTVYMVGQQDSYHGPGGVDNEPYYGFKVHKGGPLGADYSWVDVYFSSLSAAQSACATPAASLSKGYFALASANVVFKV